MPTYVYRCEDGHEFEVQQSIHDEPLKRCQAALRSGLAVLPDPCGVSCERVIQRTFFKISGAGVYKPGFQ